MRITNDQLSKFIKRVSIVATMKKPELEIVAACGTFNMTRREVIKNRLKGFYRGWSRQQIIEEVMACEFDNYTSKG